MLVANKGKLNKKKDVRDRKKVQNIFHERSKINLFTRNVNNLIYWRELDKKGYVPCSPFTCFSPFFDLKFLLISHIPRFPASSFVSLTSLSPMKKSSHPLGPFIISLLTLSNFIIFLRFNALTFCIMLYMG